MGSVIYEVTKSLGSNFGKRSLQLFLVSNVYYYPYCPSFALLSELPCLYQPKNQPKKNVQIKILKSSYVCQHKYWLTAYVIIKGKTLVIIGHRAKESIKEQEVFTSVRL